MRKPKLLLFDLGGVLIEWDGIEPLLELTDNKITPEQARRFWLESEWVRKFERGECSPLDFAAGVIDELGLEVPPNQFIEAFLEWDRGPMPGAHGLLDELKDQVPLACLSNNNELHWNRLQEEKDFGRFFRYRFLSFEIGMVKPDFEIFEFVVSRLPYEAGEIVFFDDNPECVEAAQKCGFVAFEARGITKLREHLERLGY